MRNSPAFRICRTSCWPSRPRWRGFTARSRSTSPRCSAILLSFLAFREHAIPLLRTYPYLRLWVAGLCSTGEEVYSLAILLEEEGLYERCRIYATDVSDEVLARAKSGIFNLAQMQDYTRNYQAAGGQRSLAEYYTADADYAVFGSALRAQHRLRRAQSRGRRILQRIPRDLLPQRHDLFQPRAAGARARAVLRQPAHLRVPRAGPAARTSGSRAMKKIMNRFPRPIRYIVRCHDFHWRIAGGGCGRLEPFFVGCRRAFPGLLAIVLHRSRDSDGALVDLLQHESALTVSEPQDKEPILPGRVYIAPADYHLLVESGHFCLSVDDPIRYARPSIDVLFESAADAYARTAIALVLSGAKLRRHRGRGKNPGGRRSHRRAGPGHGRGAANAAGGARQAQPGLYSPSRQDGTVTSSSSPPRSHESRKQDQHPVGGRRAGEPARTRGHARGPRPEPGQGILGQGGAAASARPRLRPDPARRADAGDERAGDGRRHPRARAVAPHPADLPHRAAQHRGDHVPRLLRRRGRFPDQAAAAGDPAREGGSLRRARAGAPAAAERDCRAHAHRGGNLRPERRAGEEKTRS